LRRTLRELDCFDADDRRWLGGRRAPQGRFNAGQKLNAAISAALAHLFALSGFLLWYGERDTPASASPARCSSTTASCTSSWSYSPATSTSRSSTQAPATHSTRLPSAPSKKMGETTPPEMDRPTPNLDATKREIVRDACRYCAAHGHLRRTTRIALAVGLVLTGINEGDILAAGHATAVTGVKIGLNFIVPFIVSNLGLLAGRR
jgi:hypothetical protein